MNRGIYVDVLLVLNFLADYVLLVSAQLLGRRRLYRGRLALAALLGALSSLAIFLPLQSFGAQWSGKLALSAAMLRVAEPWQGWRRFLWGWVQLFGVSFLYGGAMTALMLGSGPWFFWRNGALYLTLTPLSLLLCLGAGFGILQLYQRHCPREPDPGRKLEVELKLLGKSLRCAALWDSGNSLREPFSGLPVVVLDRGLFPEGLSREQLRLIPCSTVSGSTLLPAVRGESLELLEPGEKLCYEQFYVARSQEPLAAQGCQLLLSSALTAVR